MKIVAGLGNPGSKYERTRHNAGFLTLDFYAGGWGLNVGDWKQKFQAQILETVVNDQKVSLVKPQTFMNNSGGVIKAVVEFYQIDPGKDLLIIHDEVDLPFGVIRAAADSSSAGHNGVQSIITALGTQTFNRLRIGIESRPVTDSLPTDAFVLHNFTDEEFVRLKIEVFPQLQQSIDKFIASTN